MNFDHTCCTMKLLHTDLINSTIKLMQLRKAFCVQMLPVCSNGQQFFLPTPEHQHSIWRHTTAEVKSSEQSKRTAASFNACSMDAIKTFQDPATEFWQRTLLLNTFVIVCTLSRKASHAVLSYQGEKKFASFKCFKCFGFFFYF